jgi:hypothetical protein
VWETKVSEDILSFFAGAGNFSKISRRILELNKIQKLLQILFLVIKTMGA